MLMETRKLETRKRPSIKLTGGPHGIPRAVVEEVQRGRLLDAMAEVMAEEGYLATTVHKILRRAGISRRTYYEIFKDKEDCFLVGYEEAADHAIGLIREACRDGGPPEDRLERSLRAILEFGEREPYVARVFVVEVMAAGPVAQKHRARTMERVTTMVADTLAERCSSREEALLRARVLVGGVHELIYDALVRGRTRNLAELADEIAGTYLPRRPMAVLAEEPTVREAVHGS